jgi:hypothetical protein
LLGATYAPAPRGGLRALARNSRVRFKHGINSSSNSFLDSQANIANPQKEHVVIMPLIELPPRGKEVSLSLTLPEETANDVKLYARFLKATHESAPSAIVNECIRRTLKQDAEFQTWKSNAANTKSNRGGARPRKTVPPTPPQANKP